MILKIKQKEASWFLIDGIRSLSYEYMSKQKAEENRKKYSKQGPVNIMVNETYRKVPDTRICEIIVNFSDGTGRVIYTDNCVYILNNEGKTADTIYV